MEELTGLVWELSRVTARISVSETQLDPSNISLGSREKENRPNLNNFQLG